MIHVYAVIGTKLPRTKLPGTKLPIYMYRVWWLREASQIGQMFVPYMKKLQRGRIPIDPAILAATGHRFIAQKTKN